jgi:HAD superfamily hydrolase (TIGR01549 family)
MGDAHLVSLDMDGTITDTSFVDSVWLEGIPRLFAAKNSLSFEQAKKDVKTEYDKVGRERLEWYDLSYWINKFGLNVSPRTVLHDFEGRITMFPEVPRVLEKLKDKGFRLIIISNARREFVDLELEKTKITHYFEHVFSSTSDFGLIKNSARLYKKICTICKIAPNEMVHAGDDRLFDFEVPRSLGISAFYLDRTRQCKQKTTIHTLEELNQKLTANR